MSPLPLRLRPCHISPVRHHLGIQVFYSKLHLVLSWHVIPKLMRLPEFEPESILQLDLNHLGNVAAQCSRDLWEPDDGLYQQYIWSHKEQVPPLYWWGRTDNFAHKGNRNLKLISPKLKPKLHPIRNRCPTMLMKKTLPLWTSSLGSRLYLVSQKLELKIQTRFRPEFERSPKMTWLDFISGFGGICGLCLGISFVSLVEIAYWFTLRLCNNF